MAAQDRDLLGARGALGGGLGVALLLCLSSSYPLLLRFRSLALCFSLGSGFCLTLCLFFKPLLLRFRSLAFFFSVGGRFGLALLF
jgi:hypothetical protein